MTLLVKPSCAPDDDGDDSHNRIFQKKFTLGQVVRHKLSEGRRVTCWLFGVVLEENTGDKLQKQVTVRSSVLEVLFEITKYCDLFLLERVSRRRAKMTNGGVDRSVECTGNINSMIFAFECVHDGWAVAVLVGVPNKDDAFKTHPMNFLNEKTLKGIFYGNYKLRSDIPVVVEYMNKDEMKMGTYYKKSIFGEHVHVGLSEWADKAKKKGLTATMQLARAPLQEGLHLMRALQLAKFVRTEPVPQDSSNLLVELFLVTLYTSHMEAA